MVYFSFARCSASVSVAASFVGAYSLAPRHAWKGARPQSRQQRNGILCEGHGNLRATAADSSVSRVAPLPAIIYGTAWKKDDTQKLVVSALRSGFRAIDTACQPKHYNEPGVGKALLQAYEEKWLKREDVFLQTKYTLLVGQDPLNVPYDKEAQLEERVRQSLAVSLRNLNTEYLDVLIMHGPEETLSDTLKVWRVFEEFHDKGTVRFIGVSNCYDLYFFRSIYESARVKPTFLQNRFYSGTGFDVKLRQFCIDHGVKYESFWTLTHNRKFLESPVITQLATKYKKTSAQIFLAFTRALGIIPLSGTTNEEHMLHDVEITNGSFNLDDEEVANIKYHLFQ